MRPFFEECYALSISGIDLEPVNATKVGKFLLVDGDEVKRHYPGANFETMGDRTKQFLLGLQRKFKQKTSPKYCDFSLYDWNPGFSGDLRVVFPHNLATSHVEPACGTGFVATGIGLWEMGELERRGMSRSGGAAIRFECGGPPVLVGSELAHLELICDEGRVRDARFSHGLIEIMEQGKVVL